MHSIFSGQGLNKRLVDKEGGLSTEIMGRKRSLTPGNFLKFIFHVKAGLLFEVIEVASHFFSLQTTLSYFHLERIE